MTSRTLKKPTKAVPQSLASPALKQTLMATITRANASQRDSSSPTQQPEENAILQLVRDEMVVSRQLMGDIIKQEMANLRTEIRHDLETLRKDTKADITSLKQEFGAETASLRSSHAQTASTVQEIEGAINRHDSSITRMESAISELNREIGKLKDRNDDLENRSRRQNLRIIGIPEDVESGNPTAFMASFFNEVMGDEINDHLVLDRAHRSLAPKPKSGERARPMIVRMHYYSDKDNILRVSRNKGELKFRGARVHIFPDMSAELSRRRAAFTSIKAKLRQAGITYGLYHPAELRLTFNGAPHSFKAPADAEEFFNKQIRPSTAES